MLRLTVDQEALHRGVGVHQLTLHLTAHGSWLDAADTQTSASAIIGGFVAGGLPPQPLAVLPTRVLNVRSFPTNEPWPVLISDDQLLQLEGDRAGQGVDLQLDLTVTFLDGSPPTDATHTAQAVHRISAARWQELLDGAGRMVAITVRVPTPLADPAWPATSAAEPSLARAGERLREARAALRDGDALTCIRLCRHVLDNIKLIDSPQPADTVRKTAPQVRTEAQRWSAMFHDLYSLASAASHDDEITSAFTWTRTDAQAVLAATAGLFARVADTKA